ncbi:acetyl-CoA C-acyltransferase, partial [Escherichia coli]|nr:acetyl-CoA C-acyltransferase [Escherichia coli]
SPLSDGAAALVVTSRAFAEEKGLTILATVGAPGQTAGPDSSQLHSQPSDAIAAAVRKQGWDVADLDFIEINEAFGAVAVQSLRDLGADPAKVNVHGGAIALGHPIGATGARLMTSLLHELERSGGRYGLQTMCEGGGQANVTVIERL